MENTVFKGKSDKEIEDKIKNMSGKELFDLGIRLQNRGLIKRGIKINDTNVYTLGSLENRDRLNPLNLGEIYQIIDFSGEHVEVKRFYDEYLDDYSFIFFAKMFTPIYKNSPELLYLQRLLNKIMKSFK